MTPQLALRGGLKARLGTARQRMQEREAEAMREVARGVAQPAGAFAAAIEAERALLRDAAGRSAGKK